MSEISPRWNISNPVAASSHRATALRTFSITTSTQARKVAPRRRRQDPYVLAQARAKKAANLSRQRELKGERASTLGDPVRGIATPFVRSFDTALPVPSESADRFNERSARDENDPLSVSQERNLHRGPFLNFFVSRKEFKESIARSEKLSAPIIGDNTSIRDPQRDKEALMKHAEQHSNAVEAMTRMINVRNSSSKDRTRINVQKCIETFGRHNTDQTLRPKPSSISTLRNPHLTPGVSYKTPRAGPDTGSSEVQIAILTAKIRAVANFLETDGRKDKANKRNLRLLVHKRQKLLAYLRKRERGGERWQHCIQTLGLTENTWRGEISL